MNFYCPIWGIIKLNEIIGSPWLICSETAKLSSGLTFRISKHFSKSYNFNRLMPYLELAKDVKDETHKHYSDYRNAEEG